MQRRIGIESSSGRTGRNNNKKKKKKKDYSAAATAPPPQVIVLPYRNERKRRDENGLYRQSINIRPKSTVRLLVLEAFAFKMMETLWHHMQGICGMRLH